MIQIFNNWLNELIFIFQRLDISSLLDIALVTFIFFTILILLRDTQAAVLLRGVLLLIALVGLLTSLQILPAFSWLIRTTFPALLLAIPVIFSPEIRRALERLGRAGQFVSTTRIKSDRVSHQIVNILITAVQRLSLRKHGALIIIQRNDDLSEYSKTGVRLNALITPELILQIFYPNTPLHDGAIIVSGNHVIAAACVMPLSSSGVLNSSPERQMGLRHRAALGISECSDATVLVVSEETGSISLVQGGRIIRHLDSSRLENILRAFFIPDDNHHGFRRFLRWVFPSPDEKTWLRK
ncbi:MAG: diadenylate cyclase CdaA [Chloroflexota bacterium]